MAADRPGADRPVPLLLLQGKGVSDDEIAALRQSPRVQLLHARDVEPSAPAFSVRAVRATIVATIRDPAEELVFVRTSGFTGPLVFAVLPRYARLRNALRDADVLECVTLPMAASDLERVLDLVAALPVPPITHPPLGILLDAVDRTAHRGRSSVRLSQREFALLHCLMREGNRPVPVNEILDYVWGGQRPKGRSREIVDVYVSQLRKKLKRIGLRDAIRTYRGFGYGLRDASPGDQASESE